MYDSELVKDILKNILWSIDQIGKRFEGIRNSDDFLNNDEGLQKLDSICMQLINIGEALKQIDKLTDGHLLSAYQEIDWKRAKGLRDIITHHYFDIDAETVFNVCIEHIPAVKMTIEKIVDEI